MVTLSLSKGCPAERLETVPYNLVAHLLCGALGDRALQPRRSCTPLKGEGLPCGTVGNRSLQPRCSSTLRRVRGPRPATSLPMSPAGGGAGGGHPELVEGLPCGTVGNRSLQPPLHACDVGTVPRCRDCSVVGTVPRTVRKEKRRARGPRARAVIPIMMWIPKSGAFGDRALQPHRSCPPLAGVQGEVTLSLSKGCPAERLETVPYNRHYMLAM